MAHTSDNAAQTGRADVQAGLTARRRMGGKTGERGGAGQRDRGSMEESRGHTQGVQEQRGARPRIKTTTTGQADTQEGHIEEAGRGSWGEQGANKGAKEHNVSQRSTMRKTRIEPYRPPRPTIRELMEGRPAGEHDGGVPPKGCQGRPPRSAYRWEHRAEALRRVRARKIQPWPGDDQRRAHSAGEQH